MCPRREWERWYTLTVATKRIKIFQIFSLFYVNFVCTLRQFEVSINILFWSHHKKTRLFLAHLSSLVSSENIQWHFDLVSQGTMEEEDDFLHGEAPHGDSVVGMTPGSYDSHLHSPRSVGSPPISFLQLPFWSVVVALSWSQMGCSA